MSLASGPPLPASRVHHLLRMTRQDNSMSSNRLEYGVLKGQVAGATRSQSARHHTKDVHYHLHAPISAGGQDTWDMAINVGTNSPDDVLRYRFVEPFQHDCLSRLEALPVGFTRLDQQEQSPALDFCRGDIIPGGLSTLGENTAIVDDNPTSSQPYMQLARFLEEATTANALVYVFGHPYSSGLGIHDIHMNQGSTGSYTKRDGAEHNDVWEDGAILIQFADRWVALFTAFAGQQIPTDDQTGNPLPNSQVIPLG
ncbi:DUF2278 family protein [Melittangium boletus]|uniref:DUF2278 family protein n=1 Tax=Melittangium boletus TaxID=83453 RepID=UPI003DA366FB